MSTRELRHGTPGGGPSGGFRSPQMTVYLSIAFLTPATYHIPDGVVSKTVSHAPVTVEITRTLATDVHHIPRRLLKTRFADVMPCLFLHHDPPYIRCELRISSTPYHLAIHVMVALRKQTGPYLPIRGQPHPAAVSAERPRHRRDNSNLPDSIIERKPLRRLARHMRSQLHQRTIRIQPSDNLIHR